uniref:Uncharacterized protein n=1 Tax=Arundo donax TaxID=35708 RepID=A0A0A9FKC1_ARUDO
MVKIFSVWEEISTSQMAQSCKSRRSNFVQPFWRFVKKPGSKLTQDSCRLVKYFEVNLPESRCNLSSHTVTSTD